MTDRPVLTLAPVTAPSQQPPAAQADPSPPPAASADAETSKRPNPGHGVKSSASRRRPGSPPAHGDKKSPVVLAASEPSWRQWGPFHQTVSFKWPPDLVDELDNRRHDLREPVGLMVVAAITHLLDQDDETIRKLIDRAEQSKPRSGRGHHRAT